MTRSLVSLLWLVLVGAGCGSKQPPAAAAAPVATAGPTCATMAAHLGGNVAEGGDGRIVLEKVVRESCQADGWSAAAIDCLSRSTADLMGLVPEQSREQQVGGCGATLTDAQLERMGGRFTAEIEARTSSH